MQITMDVIRKKGNTFNRKSENRSLDRPKYIFMALALSLLSSPEQEVCLIQFIQICESTIDAPL